MFVFDQLATLERELLSFSAYLYKLREVTRAKIRK